MRDIWYKVETVVAVAFASAIVGVVLLLFSLLIVVWHYTLESW